MRVLAIGPDLEVSADRVTGRTPAMTRVLWGFSYDRRVTIDRARRTVQVRTRRAWVFTVEEHYAFESIDRVVLRAGELPGFSLWTYLSFGLAAPGELAFYIVGLGLSRTHEERVLFTVWEGADGWHEVDGGDAAAGGAPARRLVDLLSEYLGVPVASH